MGIVIREAGRRIRGGREEIVVLLGCVPGEALDFGSACLTVRRDDGKV